MSKLTEIDLLFVKTTLNITNSDSPINNGGHFGKCRHPTSGQLFIFSIKAPKLAHTKKNVFRIILDMVPLEI